jgi:hypothetical protein
MLPQAEIMLVKSIVVKATNNSAAKAAFLLIVNSMEGIATPLKVLFKPQWRKQMAMSPVDKGEDFIRSGMTLISDLASEKYIRKHKLSKYKVPENRLSRQCGGAGGFDDFVERFEE